MKYTARLRQGCEWAVVYRDVVDGVKEKRCYPAFDNDTELISTAETDNCKIYVLPDENTITVGAERFHCAAVLLQQISFVKEPADSATLLSRSKYDVCIRKELYANVGLSGGTAVFQGIVEHMTKVLTGVGSIQDQDQGGTIFFSAEFAR